LRKDAHWIFIIATKTLIITCFHCGQKSPKVGHKIIKFFNCFLVLIDLTFQACSHTFLYQRWSKNISKEVPIIFIIFSAKNASATTSKENTKTERWFYFQGQQWKTLTGTFKNKNISCLPMRTWYKNFSILKTLFLVSQDIK
jgi:hypothetical protein